MDAPPGRRLYLFLQRSRDRTELDVPLGTVRSEPLARLQAHVGIYPPPCFSSSPGDFNYCQPHTGCSLNHLKSKADIRIVLWSAEE
ncbi:hypothetical protein PAMP_019700 [Pampus punctatissimus]